LVTFKKLYLNQHREFRAILIDVKNSVKLQGKDKGELLLRDDPTVYYFDIEQAILVIDHGEGNKPVQCNVCPSRPGIRYEFRVVCDDGIERGPIGSHCIFTRVLGDKKLAQKYGKRINDTLDEELHKREHQEYFEGVFCNFDSYLELIGHKWLLPWESNRLQLMYSTRKEIEIARAVPRPLNFKEHQAIKMRYNNLQKGNQLLEEDERDAKGYGGSVREQEEIKEEKIEIELNLNVLDQKQVDNVGIFTKTEALHQPILVTEVQYRKYLGSDLEIAMDFWDIVKIHFITADDIEKRTSIRYKLTKRKNLNADERSRLQIAVLASKNAINEERLKRNLEKKHVEHERIKKEQTATKRLVRKELNNLKSKNAKEDTEAKRRFFNWVRPVLREYDLPLFEKFMALPETDQLNVLINSIPDILREFSNVDYNEVQWRGEECCQRIGKAFQEDSLLK
jgi:hypothetical protein